jgi:hypothetical protein
LFHHPITKKVIDFFLFHHPITKKVVDFFGFHHLITKKVVDFFWYHHPITKKVVDFLGNTTRLLKKSLIIPDCFTVSQFAGDGCGYSLRPINH